MAEEHLVFECSGAKWSMALYRDALIIRNKWSSETHTLPLNSISSIVVRRRSVLPLATLSLMAGIVGAIVRLNAIPPLFSYSPLYGVVVAYGAFLLSAICLVSALVRVLFVTVLVNRNEQPRSLRVSFVKSNVGKKLAEHFEEVVSVTGDNVYERVG